MYIPHPSFFSGNFLPTEQLQTIYVTTQGCHCEAGFAAEASSPVEQGDCFAPQSVRSQ